jgi:hypothetical protein
MLAQNFGPNKKKKTKPKSIFYLEISITFLEATGRLSHAVGQH